MTLPAAEDKAAVVEAMFDRIAPHYDRMNRLLTLRLDRSWRRRAVAALRLDPGDLVVDLGCGTGDLCDQVRAAGGRAIGVDFAAAMLAGARARASADALLRADAARLPLRDGIAAAVVSGFALRNFTSIAAVLGEAARVLTPGGRLALLEVDRPRWAPLRWGHALYFRRAVPLLGALLADAQAYRYLPQSTAYLPADAELLRLLASTGFVRARKRRLSGGIAQLLLAERA
jgi:demethylmenaquinone methyltransferase/2-methoxy-6-polyprenyl-1,4-benzoquinol methylase